MQAVATLCTLLGLRNPTTPGLSDDEIAYHRVLRQMLVAVHDTGLMTNQSHLIRSLVDGMLSVAEPQSGSDEIVDAGDRIAVQ